MSAVSWQVGPVAVTGFGAITALGADAESTWSGVLAGRRGMGQLRRFDPLRSPVAAEAPEPRVSGRVPTKASRTLRLAVHAGAEALAHAQVGSAARSRTALVIGSTGAGDAALERALEDPRRQQRHLAGYPKRMLVEQVARALGLGGPRVALNTACSSGLVAIIEGIDLLRAGWCDAVVAGGADELTRYVVSGFMALRAVDPAPCRPFDRERRGMNVGEAAAFVVLELADAARARGTRVHSLVVGAGHTCDAAHLTAPDPDGRGAARAIRAALDAAALGSAEIGWVNAHGTGTPHNDRAEARALVEALGAAARTCPVHSVKACVGHCLGAAGALEAIVAVQSLRDGVVPFTPGLEAPEAAGALAFVQHEPLAKDARFALTCSFGFGGNDAALVLERGPG